MAGPVTIAIVANAGKAVSEINGLGNAVNDTATRLDVAGRAAGKWADSVDLIGGAAAKVAGGVGDVGDGLAAMGIITEDAADGFAKVQKQLMFFAGAADIATAAAALHTAAVNAGGLAALRASVAAKAATAAQWAWNVAMSANPVGLIVIAVAALVGGLILLYKHSDRFRKILAAVWAAIKNTAVAAFDGLLDAAGSVWSGITRVFSAGVDNVVASFTWLVNLPRRVASIGLDSMRGLASGIRDGLRWVRDQIRGVGRLLPDWLERTLGIRSPSRVMARIGRFTMRGLAGGITAELPFLRRTVGRVASTITGLSAAGSVDLGGTPLPSGASAGVGNTYTVNVTVAPGADPAEAGRQVVAAIEAYERRSGRRRLAVA